MAATVASLTDIMHDLWVGCETVEHGIPYFPLFVGNIAIMLGAFVIPWVMVHTGGLVRFSAYAWLAWGAYAAVEFYAGLLVGRYATCDGCSPLEDALESPASTAWFSDWILLWPMCAVYCYVTAHRWGFGSEAWKYTALAVVAGPQVGVPYVCVRILDVAEKGGDVDRSKYRWAEYLWVALSALECVVWLPQFLAFFMQPENCWTWPLAEAMWGNPMNTFVAQSVSITGWFADAWILSVVPHKSHHMWYLAFALLAFHNLVLTLAVLWVIPAWMEQPTGKWIRGMLARPKFDLAPVMGAATAGYIVALVVGAFYVALDVSKGFAVALLAIYGTMALMSPFGRPSVWHEFGSWMIASKVHTVAFLASTATVLVGTLAQTELAPSDLALTFHWLSSFPLISTLGGLAIYVLAATELWRILSYTSQQTSEDAVAYFFKAAFAAPFLFLTSPGFFPLPGLDALRRILLASRRSNH
ncbi:uncharacterized protein AMSG_11386 [Thecamonas trahens ATCC 50062]|uniref:Uncharacterized protein n=1 Tax=Thecamonas trahens ATCC 50062 TaxID=461836 RepID=A0A0L0DUB2_THETB|nr:hypothetical protein AMSG_11386 [Thecamonas trahens ATCC 50062]KNC55919.1 hypothetical protein AMSG_11386 [Thecamonas trahens ATCC 50062]|eukprot:XP_013752737.1 hypothetical protein AMSG_11386 [Thecamonas trahens ATCC 50062]